MKKLLPKAISWDIYGTVIDWEGGTAKWFQKFLDKYHITYVNGEQIKDAWEKCQFEYIRNYRPFRQVLKDTFKQTAYKFNFPYTDEDVEDFADEMARMVAFPDSAQALRDIRALGIKIIALSNVDNDIIRESFRHENIEYDYIVTAEDVKCYKPHYNGFEYVQKLTGFKPEEMHHAAFGFKYDAVPANALGYTSVWIRRGDITRDAFDHEDLCFGDIASYAVYLKGLKAIDDENEAREKAGK